MSDRYRSGSFGMDLIIPTKKGLTEGGMPKGAIIPIGYKHRQDVMDFLNSANCNVYIAKHCDNHNVLTHIQPRGIVNRFGWYVTNMDILSVKRDWTLDVGGPGWFKRISIQNIKEINRYL